MLVKKITMKNVTENDYQLAELVKKFTNSESHYQLAEFVKYFTINDNDSHYPTLWKIEQWKNVTDNENQYRSLWIFEQWKVFNW